MLESDITQGNPGSTFGRQDTPSVERIVRAAIYKEMKNLDYRAFEYAQEDSRLLSKSRFITSDTIIFIISDVCNSVKQK